MKAATLVVEVPAPSSAAACSVATWSYVALLLVVLVPTTAVLLTRTMKLTLPETLGLTLATRTLTVWPVCWKSTPAVGSPTASVRATPLAELQTVEPVT